MKQRDVFALAQYASSLTLSSPTIQTGWTARQCTTPKLAGLPPDVASVPEPKTMGYGFDDGPNCTHNAFYNFLASQNQKATMFYIGSNVLNWPLEAQRALADGHQICIRESESAEGNSFFYGL